VRRFYTRLFIFVFFLILGLLFWILFFRSKIVLYKNIDGIKKEIIVGIIDSVKIYNFINDSGLWTKGVVIRGNADGQYEIKPKVKKIEIDFTEESQSYNRIYTGDIQTHSLGYYHQGNIFIIKIQQPKFILGSKFPATNLILSDVFYESILLSSFKYKDLPIADLVELNRKVTKQSPINFYRRKIINLKIVKPVYAGCYGGTMCGTILTVCYCSQGGGLCSTGQGGLCMDEY